MKNIVVLTGAGISAESGLKTFRDSDGLWNNHSIYEVATPEAWLANKQLVLDFYNERRKQVVKAKPNAAHYAIAELESKYDVHVITQNIDDLHERAGSKKVLHLHGEILKARSTADPALIVKIKGEELHDVLEGLDKDKFQKAIKEFEKGFEKLGEAFEDIGKELKEIFEENSKEKK